MAGPRVVLGVTGGIAAYKAAELARRLVESGADVRVVMTRGAREFVSPLTFSVLSGHPVKTEVWSEAGPSALDHVTLADWAELLLVAPLTAHTLAKFALGLADDFLSTYFLAHGAPVLLAPAMETRMWESAAVRANVGTLERRGARFVGPEVGFLASGHAGPGRMAEPESILEAALALARRRRDLEGRRVLVTAGPTREPLDPIRFLSNRSTGRMGFAVAETARDRGAIVTLLAGPTELAPPPGVRVLSFETADELHGLLLEEFPACDVLAMVAAVADFQPERHERRLHRADGTRSVRLAPGRDLLASLAPLKRAQTVIAFAAETEDLEDSARRKMEAKGADLIAVNDVGRPGVGFGAEENEVLLLTRDGGRVEVSRRSKRRVADAIWDEYLALSARSEKTVGR